MWMNVMSQNSRTRHISGKELSNVLCYRKLMNRTVTILGFSVEQITVDLRES